MRLLLLLMLLGGCASISDPVVVCPVHIHEWTTAEQHKMLVAEDALNNNSILIAALEDYATMRDEARACQ